MANLDAGHTETTESHSLTDLLCRLNPLAVYVKGDQSRGYIHIKDTLQCVKKTSELPAGRKGLRIFNQVTETFTVRELAGQVRQAGIAMVLMVIVQCIPNRCK